MGLEQALGSIQLAPSGAHWWPAGQQVFGQATGNPARQQIWELLGWHVVSEGQQLLGQLRGNPAGQQIRELIVLHVVPARQQKPV
jgi:hypothetical protein